ncbi:MULTISPECIES: hypothetical protein [unclassified Moraxella]|uniref:hypothetical protein n=1 Tax=unclassified Moraxella TaxID=2685852 RepID=UPI002B403452|nr:MULTISPECIES: hypothetical protein [unclassified Moraxella]
MMESLASIQNKKKNKFKTAAEWRSIGHPNKCTPSLCLPYSGSKDKAQYSHTVKVWTIMAKMDQLIKENKTK